MTRRCGRCGHLMAPRARYRALGVRCVYSNDLCTTCGNWQRISRIRGHYRAGRADRFVDEIVVERLLAGSLSQQPTYGELHEAIIALGRCGLSAYQIAERLRCTPRTVQRHRAAQRAVVRDRGEAA